MDKRDMKKRPCPQCKREMQNAVERGEKHLPLLQWTNCCGSWEWRMVDKKAQAYRTVFR